MTPAATQTDTEPREGAPTWLRRAGIAGFAFFAIKGLLWLIVPAVLLLTR